MKLTAADIARLNPNTRTCPVFRFRRDAEITQSLYSRFPVLVREAPPASNPWKVEIYRMFHGSGDSALFQPRPEPDGRLLRLYEAKYFSQYDHRYAYFENQPAYATQDQLRSPGWTITTRHYFDPKEIPVNLARKLQNWYLAYRCIARATDERTMIAAILPKCGVVYSANIVAGLGGREAASLLGILNSFVLDFACRQAIGGPNLQKFIVQQLPELTPEHLTARPPFLCDSADSWLVPRILELCYVAHDLSWFAEDCGYHGDPFEWNQERRFVLRCELDAACFHLYGVARDELDYIMDAFPLVKRRDEVQHGEYRTKKVIVEDI